MMTWRCALELDAKRTVRAGSPAELADAIGPAADLRIYTEFLHNEHMVDNWDNGTNAPSQNFVYDFDGYRYCVNDSWREVLSHAADGEVASGSAYYSTDQKLFIIRSHPLVRVRPNVPMRYASRNWDFGWLMLRSDGRVVYRRCDPYSLKFSDHVSQHAIRWFVR